MNTADVIAAHHEGCGGKLIEAPTTPSGLALPAGKASLRCDVCSWQIVRDIAVLDDALA